MRFDNAPRLLSLLLAFTFCNVVLAANVELKQELNPRQIVPQDLAHTFDNSSQCLPGEYGEGEGDNFTCHDCKEYKEDCDKSAQCCGVENLLCYRKHRDNEPGHSSGENGDHAIGRCDCANNYAWDKKTESCIALGMSQALYVTYFVFAAASLIAGLTMLCLACRFGCSKKGDSAATPNQRRAHRSRSSHHPRVAVVVVPCSAVAAKQQDKPPLYDDLVTSTESLSGHVSAPRGDAAAPPPAYHESLQMTSPPEYTSAPPGANQVPNGIGFDHYGFYKTVQGWLKNEPSAETSTLSVHAAQPTAGTARDVSGADNAGFVTSNSELPSHVTENHA